MSSRDREKYFAVGPPTSHPLVALIRSRERAQGAIQHAEVTVERERAGLGWGPTTVTIAVTFTRGEPTTLLSAWDPDLNAGLLELGIRSQSEEQEMLRFSLMLERLLGRIAVRFGDGFFNVVLCRMLGQDFGDVKVINDKLRHVHRDGAVSSERAAECREQIEQVLTWCASTLTRQLAYPVGSAERILVQAIANYLDDRFSITGRRMLGFLR